MGRAATLLPPQFFTGLTGKAFTLLTLFSKIFLVIYFGVTETRTVKQIVDFFHAVVFIISYSFFVFLSKFALVSESI